MTCKRPLGVCWVFLLTLIAGWGGAVYAEEEQPGTSVGIIGGADGPTSVFITTTRKNVKADWLGDAGTLGIGDMFRYGGLSGKFALFAGFVLCFANVLAYWYCRGLRWPLFLCAMGGLVFLIGLAATSWHVGNVLIFFLVDTDGQQLLPHSVMIRELANAGVPLAASSFVWLVCSMVNTPLLLIKCKPVCAYCTGEGNHD